MSYWDVLAAAAARLEADDLAAAEAAFTEALRLRERSPGRVFLSETVGDALLRGWGRLRRRPLAREMAAGRWPAAADAFRADFRARGAAIVSRALRLSDFPGAEPPAAALPPLATALHLLTRSQLCPPDPPAAVRVLRAAVTMAQRAGAPLAPELIRADLPFAEEDRLWLARKAGPWLDALLAGGEPPAAGAAIARAVLRLLDPAAFSTGGRFLVDRAWLEAELTDRRLGEAAAAVRLYRAFLAHHPGAGERAEEARVRLAELLGNVGAQHFPVPLYEEALAAADGSRPAATALAARLAAAREAIQNRGAGVEGAAAWATLAMSADGLAVVVWRESEPCDVAFWRPGDDPALLRRFLRACRGRLVRHEDGLSGLWAEAGGDLAGQPAPRFLEALLEPRLPRAGLDEEARAALASAAAAPWRAGWDPRVGHPLLAPDPRQDDAISAGTPLARPLETGLLWLAALRRLREAGPAALEGVRRLAALGDPASRFLALFIPSPATGSAGAGTEWPLPPLAARAFPTPAPLAPDAATAGAGAPGDTAGGGALLVLAEDPADALAACAPARPWRVVLDAERRLESVLGVAGERTREATLVPRGGEVHAVRPALAWLETLAAGTAAGGPADAPPDLLPLFHWLRLVETHNGDLCDFLRLRPRAAGVVPLADRYAAQAAALPRATPGAPESAGEAWAQGYAARARRSPLVVGPPSLLDQPDARLDALWGVETGASAAWVFLDSARVHWLLRRGGLCAPAALHARLAARGDAHLSLLTGAAFLRDDLCDLLAGWLVPFGPARCETRGGAAAELALAGRGLAPDARVQAAAAAAAQLAHVLRRGRGTPGAVTLLPEAGRGAEFWRAAAAGRFAARGEGEASVVPACVEPAEWWAEEEPGRPAPIARLVVPQLASLDEPVAVVPDVDTADAWRAADARRSAGLAAQRRHCALEVAALLASGASAVDIADVRWWRRWGEDDPGTQDSVPVADPRAAALRWAARAVVYDLPEVAAGVAAPGRLSRRRRAGDGTAVAVAAWMSERGWTGRDGWGRLFADDPATGGDEGGAADGMPLRLLDRGRDAAWRARLTAAAAARERGETEAWLLAVGPAPPAGAAHLLAAHPAAGSTVIPGGADALPALPGPPLLWVEPAALADPELQAAIVAAPPTAALVCDLRLWLPGPACPRLAEAAALRFLLAQAPRADFDAVGLSPAWRAWLSERLAIAPATREGAGADGPAGDTDAGPRVRRLPDPSLPCPDCGDVSPWPALHSACPACGLDRGLWLAPDAERDLRGAALRARFNELPGLASDRGASQGFQLWLRDDDYLFVESSLAIEELDHPGRGSSPVGRGVPQHPPWRVLPESASAAAAPAPAPVLGWAPRSAAEAEAFVDPRADGGATVCFQSWELSGAALPPAGVVHARALGLLDALAGPDAAEWARAWGGRLPAALVTALTGLPLSEVRAALALAAWLATCEDGAAPPGIAAGAAGERTLVPVLPLVELEYRLMRCAALVPELLPAWLAGVPEGARARCDLAEVPRGVTEEELGWLDRFLLACSLRLRGAGAVGRGNLFEGFRGREELLWRPADGLLFSTRRDAGRLGATPAVVARLVQEAERLAEGARSLLGAPRGEGEVARVVLDAAPPDAARERLVELGCLLGGWRLEGPATVRELDVPAYAWLVRSRAGERSRAATLLAALDAERREWERALGEARDGGRPVAARPNVAMSTRPPRARERGRVGEPEAARRAAAFLQADGPGALVLRGPAGTGRLAAVVAALRTARGAGAAPPETVVFCPDPALGARLHLLWRRDVDPHGAPPLCVAPAELPAAFGEAAGGGAYPAWSARGTAVLLEAQAMPREVRFAVGQRWRHGRVLATVDPVACEEPWEHLFLTTPRPEAVVECAEQVAQARRVWEQTQAFAALATGRRLRARAQRRERGEVAAHWAASLDECVALLADEQAGGRLGPRLDIVAPSPEDLIYLGRALATRGWLPVFRAELDALLLPGALEFTALVADAAQGAAADDGPSLLAPLLPEEPRADYARWRCAARDLAARPLRDLFAHAVRAPWGGACFADPLARRRVERLVHGAGAEDCARFVARPLWAAWRVAVAEWLALPPARPRGPIACLATVEGAGGAVTPALAYLCLGSEPPARHYRAFARATDRIVVLYQDLSPLTGGEAAEAD